MKTTTFIVALITLIFSSNSWGQEPPRRFDKDAFQAKRNAYITAEIDLTADEAAEFIPLDNELKDKMFEIGRECRRLSRKSNEPGTVMTEADYLKLIECSLESKIKEAQLEKEYYEKFKKIISPEKLFRYRQADAKFMRDFLDRGENRQTPPPRHP
ncbi:MAG: hypothetical protein LBR49_06085 [Tannerella sp.]|jgi:hypothetical protein|nr:hypothetical protein [Tannerella sp.]